MSNKIRKYLLYRKSENDDFFWNSISSFLNSFQTMLLLFVITHVGSANDSSIFVMAYSIGNLLYNVSKFGVRHYQVTDAKEKFKYQDYVDARVKTSILMLVSVFMYIGYSILYNGYTGKKATVVFLICVYKGIEAFEDVLHGRMQQKGRLDVAGKIWTIRLSVFIVLFAILFVFTNDLILTTLINVLITALLALVLNLCVVEDFTDGDKIFLFKCNSRKSWKKIIYDCLPLFLSAILNMYLGNGPKYIIDEKVTDEIQTSFNIVFMPVFVVLLLSNFIFQPSLKRMGSLWFNKELKDLKKLINKLLCIPIILDIFITVVGSLIGIPILGFIYGIDLTEYHFELTMFILAGGAIAVLNLYIMVLTTIRHQNILLGGYAIAALITFLAGPLILDKYNTDGVASFFLVVLVLLDIFFFTTTEILIVKERRAS